VQITFSLVNKKELQPEQTFGKKRLMML